MKGRRSLQELIRDSGVNPVPERQPCLPAPTQPAVLASEEDHAQARQILVQRRINDPDYRDPNKGVKRIFKSSKEKEKLLDTNSWTFSQEELDQALSGIIDKPATGPGLVQAFLNFGAKVNFVETASGKKNKGHKQPNVVDRRRSTVLQRAATVKRFDSVSLLASSGADQTTLDEGLKAAIAANDASCVQELLRHGADINKIPNALSDAVWSNNLNFVRLLLRAPKALRTEVISSCLPAAVQQKSEPILSLLIGHGADPNFDGASALEMAISHREYRLAVALVAGPIPLSPPSFQGLLGPALTMPTPQELYQFLQLLFCCGLPPASSALDGLLVAAAKNNDTSMAELLVRYGVSASSNGAECLKIAIAHSNWALADTVLDTSISPSHASAALAIVPSGTSRPERLHVISALVRKGANGDPVQRWLVRAVEDGDSALMNLLLNAGVPVSGSTSAIQAAVARKDTQSLRTLLKSQSTTPQSLASVFPLIGSGYAASERLEVARLLLAYGARGSGVDEALVDAVADTSTSRDVALITELVHHGADVNYRNGKAVGLAVTQADASILHLLCDAKPSLAVTSAALPSVFDTNGGRHSSTLPMMELLLAHGVEEGPAISALRIAVRGGSENLDIIQRLIAADARLLGPAFQHTIAVDSIQKKAPILKYLLTKGVPQQSLDQALAVETRLAVTNDDTTILQILLQHGGSVNYNSGEAFALGVASGNSSLLRQLLGGKDVPSRHTITKSFRHLFQELSAQSPLRGARNVAEVARELLSRGVDQPAIDSALRAVLDPVNSEDNIEPILDLLLHHHADVNVADGTCFAFAAQRNSLALFDKLLAHRPRFDTMVLTLIGSNLQEEVLLRCLKSCFEYGCTSDDLDVRLLQRKPSLVLAVERYPRSESVTKLLLQHGCNPDITVAGQVDAAGGEEMLPALVWALAQPQKTISSSVILALLEAGASPSRPSPISEVAPVALAAREGRSDVVEALLERGADPSTRDKWNRSALFYASSTSVTSVVQALSSHALPNDGSLHEAARCLQLEAATILVKHGHNPNFPSRLHGGRSALGELCLNAEVAHGNQRTRIRRMIRLFLDNGANPKFKARNERSAVILALDNPHSALEVAEALLETEVWEDLNDEKHMFRSATGLWYSPLKYIELVPSPSRAHHRKPLLDLLCDKGCEPKYYSESAEQPEGAIGMPAPIARLADRQKEHQLSLRLAQESSDHARTLEESKHRDTLRRAQEQKDAELAAASTSASHYHALEQQKHDFEIQRVREAERMKRGEKAAWHALLQEQERDVAAQRLQIEDRQRAAGLAHETRLIEARKGEVEHRAGVERKALKEKEELYERNVKRQLAVSKRLDESAKLHAGLRQERPAIEGAAWGSVD
ncbi:ankyrin [Lentithecium fluviatile CBS 122367]|uniref:Ankyrin n=1 Tax=Lentithecium fluviatile CBS 122367 TaxID=1168545 RepID=A0A6G1ICL0_9PLEO|nr:ankyrin [Lentithecium fluviatile CBS 122367]